MGITATGRTSGGRSSASERSFPLRVGSVVRVDPSPSAWAARSRFWTAGKMEESRDSAKVRRVSPADDDEHGCPGASAHRTLVHIGQERGRQSALFHVPGTPFPDPGGDVADGGADVGVAHHDEHEGLAVLRRRRVRGGGQDFGHGGVVDILGSEGSGGALAEDYIEEVGHGGDGTGRRIAVPDPGRGRYLWRCTGMPTRSR